MNKTFLFHLIFIKIFLVGSELKCEFRNSPSKQRKTVTERVRMENFNFNLRNLGKDGKLSGFFEMLHNKNNV